MSVSLVNPPKPRKLSPSKQARRDAADERQRQRIAVEERDERMRKAILRVRDEIKLLMADEFDDVATRVAIRLVYELDDMGLLK